MTKPAMKPLNTLNRLPDDVARPTLDQVLEGLIDGHGLAKLAERMAFICGEKSEHLASNWQDAKSAKVWQSAALRLVKVETFARERAL